MVRNLHLISGAREGIYGLSIRRDRKDRKLVCLWSVNWMSFTQWDLDYFHGKKTIILFTHFNHTLDSDFRFVKVFFQFFHNGWFLVALLSDCADLLFLDVLLFRSCRSDKLPFCGFKSSFSRIILCFDLRNIVGTFSAPPPALLSGIFSGKCLPKLPVACCNFKTSLTLEVITIKTREPIFIST